MSHFNLTIGYQNIEGSHSPIFGCKHEEQLNLYNDIEILSETWSSCKNCKNMQIPGYTVISKILAKKEGCKKGRGSGGLTVFCKNNLKPFTNVIKTRETYLA